MLLEPCFGPTQDTLFQGEAQMEAGQQAGPDLLVRVKTRLGSPVSSTRLLKKWKPREPGNWPEAHSGTFAQERPLAVVQQAGRQQRVVGHGIGLHGRKG